MKSSGHFIFLQYSRNWVCGTLVRANLYSNQKLANQVYDLYRAKTLFFAARFEQFKVKLKVGSTEETRFLIFSNRIELVLEKLTNLW